MPSLVQRETAQEDNENCLGASDLARSEKSTDREEETTVSNVASTIPDGGLIAWLQCAGSFSLLLNSFGVVNSFGVLEILESLPIGG